MGSCTPEKSTSNGCKHKLNEKVVTESLSKKTTQVKLENQLDPQDGIQDPSQVENEGNPPIDPKLIPETNSQLKPVINPKLDSQIVTQPVVQPVPIIDLYYNKNQIKNSRHIVWEYMTTNNSGYFNFDEAKVIEDAYRTHSQVVKLKGIEYIFDFIAFTKRNKATNEIENIGRIVLKESIFDILGQELTWVYTLDGTKYYEFLPKDVKALENIYSLHERKANLFINDVPYRFYFRKMTQIGRASRRDRVPSLLWISQFSV